MWRWQQRRPWHRWWVMQGVVIVQYMGVVDQVFHQRILEKFCTLSHANLKSRWNCVHTLRLSNPSLWPWGVSSSPKISPDKIARFFSFILFFSLEAATRDKCSSRALSVARWTGGSLRILDLSSIKLLDWCSAAVWLALVSFQLPFTPTDVSRVLDPIL